MLSGMVLYTSMLGVTNYVEICCVFIYSRVCQLKFGSLVYNYMVKSSQRCCGFQLCISSDVSRMRYEAGARRWLVMFVFYL